VKWFLLASKQNDYQSKIWLGVAFEKGEGTTLDLIESHKWYSLAKIQREAESEKERQSSKQVSSLFKMPSKLYITGRGDCVGLAGLAQQLSQPEIQESLRRQRQFLLDSGQGGLATTLKAASPELTPEQEVEMGDTHYFGRGVPRSLELAFEWWMKAAVRGDSMAEYNIGRCYAVGEGVTKDMREAIRWYESAAAKGHSDAQYNLAACYGTGNGVTKNLDKAMQLSLLSAKQGNPRAQLNLGNCYNDGMGVVSNKQEAAKWYRMAAEQGNADAQFYLGLAYGGGEGVVEDDIEAYKWYSLASAQGQPSARKLLWDYEASPVQEAEARKRVEDFHAQMAARAKSLNPTSSIKVGVDENIEQNKSLTHLPSDQRPSSGTVLVDRLIASDGRGKLTLVNGLIEDAYVKVLKDNLLVASFYVRGSGSFEFDHFPDGSYAVLFCTGFGWDGHKRDFERGRKARRYDSPLFFETRTTREGSSIVTSTDVLKLTLHAVPDGNAKTSDLSLDEFDRY
jgi:TPR repeat protein